MTPKYFHKPSVFGEYANEWPQKRRPADFWQTLALTTEREYQPGEPLSYSRFQELLSVWLTVNESLPKHFTRPPSAHIVADFAPDMQAQHQYPPQETHPDPDPYFRELEYSPRVHQILSQAEYQIAMNRKPSQAEQAEINLVNERVLNPTFYPVDRTQPLAWNFIPDQQDEPLLNECTRLKTPEALFPPQWNRGTAQGMRYIHIRDRSMVLIRTDGACLENGSEQPARPPRAGYAYVYSPPLPNAAASGICSGKLEPADATSNRAELIAVITALRTRCTQWCRVWQGRRWRTAAGKPLKNNDLWEELIYNIEWMRHRGCEVMFWQIPREWNTKADLAAKKAAGREE
ncbi:ribonuclease H-like domain-containing protein [Gymnopilus junonius]|uniref:Ribonuclease H-like domain-containing protein n=1 Tax=Gymnopilus junonius TaxID=109634 RepID=A0A9P5P3Z1_GYMJU|nr:ribonuclease H-like domain-containing protein [Gymnopilus junonius]